MKDIKLKLLIIILGCSSAFAMTKSELEEKLQKHLNGLDKKMAVSMRVEILGTGETIFAHNDSKGLNPASSTKLITSAAALDFLGPSFTFKTEILAKRPIRNGEIDGNLVIKGNGDPFLVSERLWLLARDIARTGIKKINGGIAVDNTSFGKEDNALLAWSKLGEKYATVVSATSLNFNNLEVQIIPSMGGHSAIVETGPVPHDYAIISNQVKVVGGNSADITVTTNGMRGDQEKFIVSGSIGKNSGPKIQYAAVSNASSYIAHAFAALLRKEGILIKGSKDYVGQEETKTYVKLASLESEPLNDLVRSLNTYSNNFMTEQIYHALGSEKYGEPATAEKSKKAVREFLSRHESCNDATLENGSGLSWETKISANCFVKVFQKTYRDFKIFADLIGSVPIGKSSGTLKNRFKASGENIEAWSVRAKTGTLWSRYPVTSLVGVTRSRNGLPIVFAILLNYSKDKPEKLSSMREWEEKCIEYFQQLSL